MASASLWESGKVALGLLPVQSLEIALCCNGPLLSASRATRKESEMGVSESGSCELWSNLKNTLPLGLRAS